MSKLPSADKADNVERNRESRIFEADKNFAAARDDALLHEILILSAINRALIDQLIAKGGIDGQALNQAVSGLLSDPDDLERRLRPSELHTGQLSVAVQQIEEGLRQARIAKHQKRSRLEAERKRLAGEK